MLGAFRAFVNLGVPATLKGRHDHYVHFTREVLKHGEVKICLAQVAEPRFEFICLA